MSKKLGSFAVAAIASSTTGSAQPSIAVAAGQPQWVLDYETGKVTVVEPGSKEQMLMQYVDQIQNQVMQAVVDVSECGPCWLRMLLDEGGHVVKVAEGLDDAAGGPEGCMKVALAIQTGGPYAPWPPALWDPSDPWIGLRYRPNRCQ